MAPIAITPPAVETKSFNMNAYASKPSLQRGSSYMGTKRKIVCFSDFDGTIFMQDTGHILFNSFGCGSERRAVLDKQINSGERTFRDVSEEMWGSLDVPFESGFEVMKDALDIDPDFKTFHTFCVDNDIPFNVVSAGLKPVLRRVLDHFLGDDESSHIDIIANDAHISEEGKWEVEWIHDNEKGHDKEISMKEAREAAKLACESGTVPLIVFIGDGVSDLPAARQADVLFARRGLRLEEYCIENKLRYIAFDTFADIQREITKIAKEDEEKTKGRGLPSKFNPRANMWRRVSSKNAIPIFAAMSPGKEKMMVWPDIFSQVMPEQKAQPAAIAAPSA